jgi:fluoride ion exporter CrcB/FEX
MLDTLTLGNSGQQSLAFWNVALQTLCGFAAVWGGYRFGIAVS